MINKLKADLEQQQLSCSKTSELDTNLQTLNNHLEKLVTIYTEIHSDFYRLKKTEVQNGLMSQYVVS
jgi:hypothetical protein